MKHSEQFIGESQKIPETLYIIKTISTTIVVILSTITFF